MAYKFVLSFIMNREMGRIEMIKIDDLHLIWLASQFYFAEISTYN